MIILFLKYSSYNNINSDMYQNYLIKIKGLEPF